MAADPLVVNGPLPGCYRVFSSSVFFLARPVPFDSVARPARAHSRYRVVPSFCVDELDADEIKDVVFRYRVSTGFRVSSGPGIMRPDAQVCTSSDPESAIESRF